MNTQPLLRKPSQRFSISLAKTFGVRAAQAAALASRLQAPYESVAQLEKSLAVGDVLFIQVRPLPFKKVSEVTQSWTNHVGIVVDVTNKGPVIAESTFPFSRTITLPRFVRRSQNGRIAVARLDRPLSDVERLALKQASHKHLGIFYDTGFNLESSRQFCSRFVRELLQEVTGETVGEIETFGTLLQSAHDVDLTFWRAWYFGKIPGERKTVTPASVLLSPRLRSVFDGYAS